jgi:hypothetical protein
MSPSDVVDGSQPAAQEQPLSTATTIGLDYAKSVFQVHGIRPTGEVLIRRQIRRGQVRSVKEMARVPLSPRW